MTEMTQARPRALDVREMVTAALLTALLAASAYVSIPVGTVPVTLQVFIVLLAALMLRPAAAGAAVGVYILLGAAGAPVFSGAKGGLGVLVGPTGGYILGFLAAAMLGALVRRRVGGAMGDFVAIAVAVVAIYVIGWAQLALVAQMSAEKAFLMGVAPFVVIDAAKGAVALALAATLRRAGFGS